MKIHFVLGVSVCGAEAGNVWCFMYITNGNDKLTLMLMRCILLTICYMLMLDFICLHFMIIFLFNKSMTI